MTSRDLDPHRIDESSRRRFESSWLAGKPIPIVHCLPPEDDASYLGTLDEFVHIDMEFAWKNSILSQADVETLAPD